MWNVNIETNQDINFKIPERKNETQRSCFCCSDSPTTYFIRIDVEGTYIAKLSWIPSQPRVLPGVPDPSIRSQDLELNKNLCKNMLLCLQKTTTFETKSLFGQATFFGGRLGHWHKLAWAQNQGNMPG